MELHSLAEVAKDFGISRTVIYVHYHAGHIKGQKIGKQVLVTRAQIERYKKYRAKIEKYIPIKWRKIKVSEE
jgi:excisionase family DNA binding protein